MFSSVGSAPSTFNAFTVSFKEPSETYPIAYSLSATVDNITDVLFVMLASSVVLSTFSPEASFSSIPNNSIKAPLVPEPSSLETTEISFAASNSVSAFPSVLSELPEFPHPTAIEATIATVAVNAKNFFIFIFTFLLFQ